MKNPRELKHSSAFSLVELMVAMGIFAMVTYLVLISTVSNRSSYAIASATIFLNAQARQAVSNLRRDLLEAKTSSIVLEDETGQDTGIYRRIRFKIPLIDSDGDLMTTTGGDIAFGADQSQNNYIRYALNGTNLEKQVVNNLGAPVGTAKMIAQNVSTFTVVYDSDLNQYEITIGLALSNYEGIVLSSPMTFNSTIAVTPRN